jgi:hypothetical protein
VSHQWTNKSNFETIFNKEIMVTTKKLWYWYFFHTAWWLYCHEIVNHNLVAMFPSDNM